MNESLRVVVVEDDDVDIMAMNRALRSSGILYTLATARDGVEALELLRDGTPAPHILFLDLNMPRMGGLELLDALHRAGLTIPNVVVLSTSGASKDRDGALARGVTGYVVKSEFMGDFSSFASTVATYLRNARPETRCYERVDPPVVRGRNAGV